MSFIDQGTVATLLRAIAVLHPLLRFTLYLPPDFSHIVGASARADIDLNIAYPQLLRSAAPIVAVEKDAPCTLHTAEEYYNIKDTRWWARSRARPFFEMKVSHISLHNVRCEMS